MAGKKKTGRDPAERKKVRNKLALDQKGKGGFPDGETALGLVRQPRPSLAATSRIG